MQIVHSRWISGLVVLSLIALILPLFSAVASAQSESTLTRATGWHHTVEDMSGMSTGDRLAAMPAAARQGSGTVVGASSVAFSDEWVLTGESSSSMAYLTHRTLSPEVGYVYTEIDNANLPILDALYVIEIVVMDAWRESFGVASTPYLVQGPASADRIWELFSAEMTTGPMLVLVSADVTRVPGRTAVEFLMASPDTFAAGFASAQTGITMNGQPNQFSAIDANAVLSGAGITAAPSVAQQQNPQQQPQAPGIPASQPAPPTQPVGTVAVGTDSIAYGGEWQYLAEDSQDTLGLFQSTTNSSLLYAYLVKRGTGTDAATAVQQLSQGFFSDFAAGTVQSLPAETLPSGVAWSLHIEDEAGVKTIYLMSADVSMPDTYRYQVLSAPLDAFPTTLTSLQGGIQINGAGAFAGIDPSYATSLVGGAPAVAQTGQAAPPAVTQSGSGTANYQIEDSPTGCDRIGWVITDPTQRPVSQAEIDTRSSCVGGASYVASCGNYLVGDVVTSVQCTVNVAVLDAPMTVSSAQLTLVDAAGNRYVVDTETLYMLIMLFGVPELPEATVQANSTVSGTVLFAVPNDAPMPWVVEVAPETLATTGEQPGVLVIDGPLQDFEILEQ